MHLKSQYDWELPGCCAHEIAICFLQVVHLKLNEIVLFLQVACPQELPSRLISLLQAVYKSGGG